jgi:hypothetical protein
VSDDPDDQLSPVVAYSQAGDVYLVVWTDRYHVGPTNIYGRYVDANGNPVGSRFAVALDRGELIQVRVVAGGGIFLVMWREGPDRAAASFYVQRVGGSFSGDPLLGSPILVHSPIENQFQAVYNPDRNEFLLIWLDPRNPILAAVLKGEVLGRMMTPGGDLLSQEVNFTPVPANPAFSQILNSATYQADLSAAYNSNLGQYLLTYGIYNCSNISCTIREEVRGQRIDGASLSRLGSTITVTPNLVRTQWAARVLYDPRLDQYAVFWNDNRIAESDFAIFAQRVSAQGLLVGTNLTVVSEHGSQFWPEVVYLDVDAPLPRYFLAWEDDPGAIPHFARGAFITEGLTRDGEIVDLSAEMDSNQQVPQVASNHQALPNFLAVWQHTRPGHSADVHAQYLSALAEKDSDRDGLSDTVETDVTFTDPFNVDTDGDGLIDSWEAPPGVAGAGFDLNADGVPDVRSNLVFAGVTAPNPLHKDIYVEIDLFDCNLGGCPLFDTMEHPPHPDAIGDLTAMVRELDLQNPDGDSGANLHILVDERMGHDPECDLPPISRRPEFFGTSDQREDANIVAAKELAFRYVLSGHSAFTDDPDQCVTPVDFILILFGSRAVPDFDNSPFGRSQLAGRDIIVTLGPLWICRVGKLVTVPIFGTITACDRESSFDPGLFPARVPTAAGEQLVSKPYSRLIAARLGISEEEAIRQVWARALAHLLGHGLGLVHSDIGNSPTDGGPLDPYNGDLSSLKYAENSLYSVDASGEHLRYTALANAQLAHAEATVFENPIVDLQEMDLDGDGIREMEDNCTGVNNSGQEDMDGDTVGDACDRDIDHDGLPNEQDLWPRDTDNDGIANPLDDDDDDDRVVDSDDNCSIVSNADQGDVDADGIGDLCDADADGDEVPDFLEFMTESDHLSSESIPEFVWMDGTCGDQIDNDLDGKLDTRDEGCIDTDHDSLPDHLDTCPAVADFGWPDIDGDGVGNVCDGDTDGDSYGNSREVALGSDPLDLQSTPEHFELPDTCADGIDNDRGGFTDSEDVGCTPSNSPPVAVAGGPYIGSEGSTLAFDGTGSADPDGDPVTLHWTFGDGASQAGSAPEHAYGDNGPYQVCLTVTDPFDASTTDCTIAEIVNVVPTVILDTSRAIAFAGGNAFLGLMGVAQSHEASATDVGSDDLTFSWSFGVDTTYFNDGTGPDPIPSAAGLFPFHAVDVAAATFALPGVYDLTLTVSDDDGGSALVGFTKLVTGAEACSLSQGFWKHQFSGQGKEHIDDATLQAYLQLVNFASRVFSESVPASTLAEAKLVMKARGSGTRAKAQAQLLAAWLNFANGAVGRDQAVPLDDDDDGAPTLPFHELIAQAETILLDLDASRRDLKHAKDLAEAVNLLDEDNEACEDVEDNGDNDEGRSPGWQAASLEQMKALYPRRDNVEKGTVVVPE